MIDEQSSASEQDYASDRSAIGPGRLFLGEVAQNLCVGGKKVWLRIVRLWTLPPVCMPAVYMPTVWQCCCAVVGAFLGENTFRWTVLWMILYIYIYIWLKWCSLEVLSVCVMMWCKCQLSGDAPQSSSSSINDVHHSGSVLLIVQILYPLPMGNFFSHVYFSKFSLIIKYWCDTPRVY